MKLKHTKYCMDEETIAPGFRLDTTQKRVFCLVKGHLDPWKGNVIDVFSPIPIIRSGKITEKMIGSSPSFTKKQALSALSEAIKAYNNGLGMWPSKSLADREKAITEFLGRLSGKKKKIIQKLMWEIAKPYVELENEFDRTLEFAQTTIKTAKKEYSGMIQKEKGIYGFVRLEPLGVALCMGPYNYPFFETFSLVIPALLMGNTVLVKPPKFGVLFFQDLLEDLRDCFPAGTINVIFGDSTLLIPPLMESGHIDIFAFIGTTKTANELISLHPKKNRLRTLLGLEAKNAAVVMADADCEAAAKEILLGALAFNGQRCAALKIIFVSSEIVECFLQSLKKETAGIKTGMPWLEGVRITPLVDPQRIPYLKNLLEDARNHGAQVLNPDGGKNIRSLFFPALLYPVNSKMRIYHEEQFGPIIPIVPFDSVQTPIKYILDSSFGQQISLFGKDTKTLADFHRQVKRQVARVNINIKCQRGPDSLPFTGRKDSARGDFSPNNIWSSFSLRTTVAVRESRTAQRLIKRLKKDI